MEASTISKRILLVVRGLDPVGTGRQVELAARGLRNLGYDVSLAVTTRGGEVANRLSGSGVPLHSLGRRPGVDGAATASLWWLAAELRPDVILGFGRSAAVPLAWAKRLCPRSHSAIWLGLPPRQLSTIIAARLADVVMASSPGVAAASARLGLHPDRLVVVPPGISPDLGRELPRHIVADRLGLDPQKHWTLAVAPLEPEPRLRRLLWAIDQLGVVRKDLQHVLIGAGPLRGNLERRGRAQDLSERLFILPHCDSLADLLGHTKLVWQPGHVALGGAILDGMARGLPVVAVESDAARQFVIDGVTGRIVSPEPESDFPRRAFNILEDEHVAQRYGAAGAARAAAEFSVERFVAGVASAINARR